MARIFKGKNPKDMETALETMISSAIFNYNLSNNTRNNHVALNTTSQQSNDDNIDGLAEKIK